MSGKHLQDHTDLGSNSSYRFSKYDPKYLMSVSSVSIELNVDSHTQPRAVLGGRNEAVRFMQTRSTHAVNMVVSEANAFLQSFLPFPFLFLLAPSRNRTDVSFLIRKVLSLLLRFLMKMLI